MKPDRVVLDTNVFISLILTRRLDRLVAWHKDNNVRIYTCEELLEELKEVLARKHIKKNLTQPLSAYLRFIKSVTTEVVIDPRFDRAPDLKDNFLFDWAYTTKSHFVVTGDRPLLNMKQVNRIKVVSLSEWQKSMLSTE